MLKKLLKKYNTLPVQIRASFWFLICSFLQRGISVITTPIFTRLLSTTEFGQYNVFSSWLNILTVFVTLNLYSGVFTSGLVKFEEYKYKFASAMQGLCTTLVVAWTIVYLAAHNFWNNLFSLSTVQMLSMLVMMWATAVFNFWSVEQRVDFKYKKLVIITLIVSLAKPIVGIVFVILADDKVTARILGLALVELIGYSGLFYAQMKRGKIFFSKEIWKYALAFNIPLIPHYLSMNVLNGADRIMISNMVGDSEAGIYSLAYSVSQVMTIFNTALIQTVEPWLYKKINKKQQNDIPRVAYVTFALIASVNIMLIAFAPEIVSLFAPQSYHGAIMIIPSVAMSVYFMFAYTYFAVFEFYFKKTIITAVATVIGAILNIILNYIFIPIYGYYAAGYTTLFCYIVYAVMHYIAMTYICKKYMEAPVPYRLKTLLLITVIFMLVGFVFLLSYNNILLRYLIVVVLSIIIIIKRKKIIIAMKKLVNVRKEGKK